MPTPDTAVSRMREKQIAERQCLDCLLDSTPLATVAFVREGLPVALPIGFVRVADELVVHGSTGSPWLRHLAAGAQAAVSVSVLDGVVVARSVFESSFRYRSAVVFGSFEAVADEHKPPYLQAFTNTFIPGRVVEVRRSTPKERAATMVLRTPIDADNWSLKVDDGWSEDPEEDIASGVWAGVVPITMTYGEPQRSPDCDESIPVPPSVRSMTGVVRNRA